MIVSKTEYQRQWRKDHPDAVKRHAKKFWKNHPDAGKDAKHKRRYGISLADKATMLALQGGCCAICKTTESSGLGWATDHDHFQEVVTGQIIVRGILCVRCNVMLGHAQDNEATLLSAIDYLRKSRG
jgi:hypothetical protein